MQTKYSENTDSGEQYSRCTTVVQHNSTLLFSAQGLGSARISAVDVELANTPATVLVLQHKECCCPLSLTSQRQPQVED